MTPEAAGPGFAELEKKLATVTDEAVLLRSNKADLTSEKKQLQADRDRIAVELANCVTCLEGIEAMGEEDEIDKDAIKAVLAQAQLVQRGMSKKGDM